MLNDGRPKVFVSHSHEDAAFAERLERALGSGDIVWWRDVHDIALGDYFREKVTENIRDCDVFLLLVSPDSITSREVIGEVELAYEEGKRIIPAYLTELTQPLPGQLVFTTGLNRIEFYKDFDRGVEQLAQYLGRLRAAHDRSEGDLLPYSIFCTLDRSKLEELVRRLRERIASGRSDARVHAKLGEYLLHLGRPDDARPHLVEATRQDRSSARAPYLLAIALIRGRRPRVLSMSEVDNILRVLDRAEEAEPGLGHVAMLGAIVKTDYYDGNGLLASPPTAQELWARARTRGVDVPERRRIAELVSLDEWSLAELDLVPAAASEVGR